jgi:hypothetical protein
MSSLEELQRRTEAFLATVPARAGASPLAAAAAPAGGRGRRFSTFVPDQMERAVELATAFMRLATATGGEAGLERVLDEAQGVAATEDADLVRYALMVFITHHPEGRRLPIPSLTVRSPELVQPSPGASAAARAVAAPPARARPARAPRGRAAEGGDPETRLAWFREDPYANEHHQHWHVVYPFVGVPDVRGTNPPQVRDRQGELFFYMHRQMLARYDAERLAAGLPRVEPFSDYRAEIRQGYDSGLPGYSPRPPGTHLGDIKDYTVHEHERRRDRLLDAVSLGRFEPLEGRLGPVTPDSLGATEEASIASASGPSPYGYYGSHHNYGHVLLARAHDPVGDTDDGVMIDTATAIRDPIFWRWHKHIDDVLFRWQELQPPHNLSDAPPVIIRKDGRGAAARNQSPDIILCFQDAIAGAGTPDFDGEAFGRATFGGDHWDSEFFAGGVATGELHTVMIPAELDGKPSQYLDQKAFSYFIRVANPLTVPQDVTVRIFLAPEAVAGDRRMWIEMDKFRRALPASERGVIFREAALSSVIRKPASKPPGPPHPPTTDPNDQENFCNCGWPFNLLVPRGRREGMRFLLLVMFTDWEKDRVDFSTCGSMSFCGAKDRYPDRRPMGYPFDRPIRIGQTIRAQANIAVRPIVIREVDRT